MDERTLGYYDQNADRFAAGTVSVDLRQNQERFLAYLRPGARILDFGCGSGRDAKYFLERGYRVDAADGSGEMCRIAGEYAGIPVRQMMFGELDAVEAYDGVWACSSILHLPEPELRDVMGRIRTALKSGGILYASFKYGRFAGRRGERYFTDFTEETFREFAQRIPGLGTEESWITADARPGREAEQWLNVILRRKEDG